MGWGVPGTPLFIPDPREPDELLHAVYMHAGLMGMSHAVGVYEVNRMMKPVRPGVYRMASHRTAGLTGKALRAVARREVTKFSVTGAMSLMGMFHPYVMVPEMMMLSTAAFPGVAGRQYQSAATGQPSIGGAALSKAPAKSWGEFFSLDYWIPMNY